MSCSSSYVAVHSFMKSWMCCTSAFAMYRSDFLREFEIVMPRYSALEADCFCWRCVCVQCLNWRTQQCMLKMQHLPTSRRTMPGPRTRWLQEQTSSWWHKRKPTRARRRAQLLLPKIMPLLWVPLTSVGLLRMYHQRAVGILSAQRLW